MNGNLFKVVLISVIAILLAIIGGAMSADGDPVSIALAMAPFVLAGLYLMKEKVWYLWIWLPIICNPFDIFNSYGPLLAYSITLPFYIWNIMLRRSSLTRNSIPLLDAVIFLLFIHVGYIFLTHPFGLGINILEDYYGGRGYIIFLQGLLAYLCLSSLKTDSYKLGRVLQWAVFLSIAASMIITIRNLIMPDSAGAELETSNAPVTDDTRELSFTYLSLIILQVLILNYSVWQILKRPWWIILGAAACAGLLISGFRSYIAQLLMLFFVVSILYRRWFISMIAPALGLLLLLVMSSAGILHELPFGVQRTLSVIPFLDVSLQARRSAEGSTEWRVEMWRWALDDRKNFIQNKVFGDGFSRNIGILKANVYEKAYKLSHDQSDFAWNGSWHSGPISTIQTIGYIGLSLYTIISIIGMIYAWLVCCIYRYHPYKLGILYVAAMYFISPTFFFLIFGDSIKIPGEIISLGIIKVLFCCAKREGLYGSLGVRKEYMPLMIRQAKKTPLIPNPAAISS